MGRMGLDHKDVQRLCVYTLTDKELPHERWSYLHDDIRTGRDLGRSCNLHQAGHEKAEDVS